jgi:predicted LPLAT superfamily acyltransferase
MMLELIRGAIQHAANHGATVVEAYPTRPRAAKMTPVSSFMGIPAVFKQAGFVLAAEPSASKVIMRYRIQSLAKGSGS